MTFVPLTCELLIDILALMRVELDERRLYDLIGIKIRELRGQRRQEELAEAIGMQRTSVANIESGRQKTPLHVVYKLCALLDVEVALILPKVEEVVKNESIEIEVNNETTQVTPKTAAAIAELEKLLNENATEGLS